MSRLHRITLAVVAVHALVLSTVVSGNSDVIADPEGDVGSEVPAYLDIVQAKVTEQVGKGVLFFHMELAAAVPETPTGLNAFVWNINVQGGRALDYTISVRGCDATLAGCGSGPAHWDSFLLDFSFTPPKQTPSAFPFKIDGATVKAYVDPALIGDPSGFDWNAFARSAPPLVVPLPVDRAPDTGITTFVR